MKESIPDNEYDAIVSEIYRQAATMPRNGQSAYRSYDQCKNMLYSHVGYDLSPIGQARYRKFIDRICTILKM